MGQFKTLTEALISWLEGNAVINAVTIGDIGEVDLSTHTDFPLAHIIYDTPTYTEGVTEFTYQVLLLDTYVEGTDEKIDVIDRMSEVATSLVAALYSGTVLDRRVRVNTDPTSQIMYDQLGNRLYGISLQLDLKVPAGVVIC